MVAGYPIRRGRSRLCSQKTHIEVANKTAPSLKAGGVGSAHLHANARHQRHSVYDVQPTLVAIELIAAQSITNVLSLFRL